MAQIGDIIISLEARLDKFQRGMDQANKQLDGVDRNTKNLSRSFERMEQVASRVSLVMKGIVLGGVIQSIGNAALAAERLTNSLRFATGSAEGAADALKFVRAESDRLGLQATKTAEAFSGIAAAAQGTALEGESVREIFLGVAEASGALNLSAENTEGALLALSQMISKGTVQAEELRGQLGERIPGAFQIAARAMGVTTAELGKMLERGEVIADEFLPRFATEMRRSFGDAATSAATGLNASINRLKNSYDELLRTLAETGVIDAATRIITNLGNILFNVSTIFNRAKTAVIEFFDQFRDAPQTLTGTAAKLDTLSKKIIRLSEQRINSPFPEKLDEHIAELRAEYDKLQEAYLDTSDAQGELTIEIKNGFQPVNVLSNGLEKLGTSAKKTARELTAMEKAQAKFNKAIDDYPAQQIVRELEEQFRAQEEATQATQRFVEQADPMVEAFENAFRRMDDAAANMWQSFFEGGKSALDNIKSFVTQTLAEIAHALTTKRLVMNITGAVGIGGSTVAAAGTGGGFGGGGFNPGSLFGLSGGATTKGASPISPMAAGAGFPGGGASSLPFSGDLGFLNNSSFVSNPFTSALGGFAGNLGANALFGGNRGAGAGIGGTLGSIAGSFLPIPIPGVGTAIGGFLGNAIGGLFGGGGKKTRIQLAGSGEFQNDAFAQSAFGTIGFSDRGTQKFDASKQQEFLNSLAQLDNALASTLLPEQIDRISQAMQNFRSHRQRDDFDIGELARERLDVIFSAMGEGLDRLSDSGRPIEQIVADFTTLRGAMDALEQAANPAESIGPFEASLRQLQAVFDNGAAAAKRLGLDVDDMQANLRQAARNLRDSFNTDIQAAILAITDPAQAEIAALEQRRDALLKEADAINASTGAVNRLIDLHVGKVLERQAMEAERAQQELARQSQQAQQEAQRQAEERQRQIDQLTKQFDTAMQPVTDFLRESASTAFASSQRSLVQVMQDQFNAAMSLTRAYDGSIDSLTAMSGAVRNFRNTELQLLQQIDQAQQSIASSFSSTIEQITVAGLRSEEQRFNFFKSQAESLAKALGSLTDPSEIARVSQEINRLTGSAFGQLGTDEQRQALSGQFAGFLRNVQGLAEERLEIAQRDVVDRGQAIQTAIEASMGRVVVKFETAAKQQEDAARVSLQAAREALQAARTPVRVEVAPVRVQLEAANDEVGGSR